MKWLCYLVLLLFVAFTFLKVRAVRGTVHERYHFHHVFHSPNAKRRRKHSSRFMQQIVNNFVGDDGPVAPVLNVHLEVPSPPEYVTFTLLKSAYPVCVTTAFFV